MNIAEQIKQRLMANPNQPVFVETSGGYIARIDKIGTDSIFPEAFIGECHGDDTWSAYDGRYHLIGESPNYDLVCIRDDATEASFYGED